MAGSCKVRACGLSHLGTGSGNCSLPTETTSGDWGFASLVATLATGGGTIIFVMMFHMTYDLRERHGFVFWVASKVLHGQLVYHAAPLAGVALLWLIFIGKSLPAAFRLQLIRCCLLLPTVAHWYLRISQ